MRVRLACVVCVVVGFFAAAGGVPSASVGPSVRAPEIAPPDFSSHQERTVVRTVDGDTLVVAVDGENVKVRLIGVDTPETVHPSKPVQYYGREASTFTKNLLLGERVFLIGQGGRLKRDRYGRLLAYVYRAPDGLFINAELIRQGYAHVYAKYPFKHLDAFRKLEAFARTAHKGLWKEPVPSANAVGETPQSKAKRAPGAAPASAEDPIVYVTENGSKYHRGQCRYLKGRGIPMRLSEARKSYEPCRVCRPGP